MTQNDKLAAVLKHGSLSCKRKHQEPWATKYKDHPNYSSPTFQVYQYTPYVGWDQITILTDNPMRFITWIYNSYIK